MEDCPVCLCEFKKLEKPYSCSHGICKSCKKQWEKGTCPLCRAVDVTPPKNLKQLAKRLGCDTSQNINFHINLFYREVLPTVTLCACCNAFKVTFTHQTTLYNVTVDKTSAWSFKTWVDTLRTLHWVPDTNHKNDFCLSQKNKKVNIPDYIDGIVCAAEQMIAEVTVCSITDLLPS